MTALELAEAIRAGELSPVEITDHYLDRIDRLNEQTGAFYTVTADLAREQAAAAAKVVADARRTGDQGSLPPLTGVPIPIKDLNMVAGVRMTMGSVAFADFVPTEDDYVVVELRKAGIVITGKTAAPEFGLPCYTETKIGPPARTPWDLTRSAGGSSGGAAAAVAAGLAPAAHGSDGAGSIRIPSSVCGLFGIKPSRGRISGGPLMPDLNGLSTDGPITRTVADAALLLDVMTCSYPGDMYSVPPLPAGETFLGHVGREPGRLRIGRTTTNLITDEVHPDCLAAFEDASNVLAGLGHDVEDIEYPFSAEAVPFFEQVYYSMATLTPLDAAQEGQLLPFTAHMRSRGAGIKAGELLFAEAYLQGTVRAGLAVLNQYDAVLTPTVTMPPRPVGWFDELGPAESFERQKRFAPYPAIYNISGQPAVNLPLHWNAEGLPIGVMLAGRMGDEATLISLSAQVEAARPWRNRHPEIWHA